jgi:hypothetical protein
MNIWGAQGHMHSHSHSRFTVHLVRVAGTMEGATGRRLNAVLAVLVGVASLSAWQSIQLQQLSADTTQRSATPGRDALGSSVACARQVEENARVLEQLEAAVQDLAGQVSKMATALDANAAMRDAHPRQTSADSTEDPDKGGGARSDPTSPPPTVTLSQNAEIASPGTRTCTPPPRFPPPQCCHVSKCRNLSTDPIQPERTPHLVSDRTVHCTVQGAVQSVGN